MDNQLIWYQILRNNIMRTVWQAVRRITNEISGVKGLATYTQTISWVTITLQGCRGYPWEIQQLLLPRMLESLHDDRRRTLKVWRIDWLWSDSGTCGIGTQINRSGRTFCYNMHNSRRSTCRRPLHSDMGYSPSHVPPDGDQTLPRFWPRCFHLFVDLLAVSIIFRLLQLCCFFCNIRL